MLSPKFLRFVAARCVRSARGAANSTAAAELDALAADLECWAKEAEDIATLAEPYDVACPVSQTRH
jgi:hypothetical protein